MKHASQKGDIYLRAREDDLAGDEDEQDDLRLDHAVDQSREELRYDER